MARSRVVISSAIILAVLMALFAAFLFSKSRTTQMFGDIFARVETERPVIALTFDDGPSVRFTPEVLALLKEWDVTATFFLIGREIEENPAGIRAIIEAGHQVGNHTYSHPDMTLAGPQTVASEIERTDAAIRAAGYQGEIYFRPPYGKKLVTLPWYLSRNDRKTIMWDVEPESFPEAAANADLIAEHVIENARNGSIVLMHVMYGSRRLSREALPKIIDGLRARGFEFVTVSQLIDGQ